MIEAFCVLVILSARGSVAEGALAKDLLLTHRVPHPFALFAKGWDSTVLSRLPWKSGALAPRYAPSPIVILSGVARVTRDSGCGVEGPAFDLPCAASFRPLQKGGIPLPSPLAWKSGALAPRYVLPYCHPERARERSEGSAIGI